MEFITPPNHFGFKAKKIYGNPIEGTIRDCAIAYVEPNGGGPKPAHAHPHSHFFIILEGTATIYMDNKRTEVEKDEAIHIDGGIMHSIMNESDVELKMIGITID